jgi:hypothetical protein
MSRKGSIFLLVLGLGIGGGIVPNNVPNNAPMIFPNLLFICSFDLFIPYTLQNVPYDVPKICM